MCILPTNVCTVSKLTKFPMQWWWSSKKLRILLKENMFAMPDKNFEFFIWTQINNTLSGLIENIDLKPGSWKVIFNLYNSDTWKNPARSFQEETQESDNNMLKVCCGPSSQQRILQMTVVQWWQNFRAIHISVTIMRKSPGHYLTCLKS